MVLVKVTLSLVVVLVVLGSEWCCADNYDTEEEQEEYFKQFKYLGDLSVDPDLAEMVDKKDMFVRAVTNFQMMAGINITGEMDEETKEFMRMPRCGVADQSKKDAFTRRRKRYALGGPKWDKTSLTYRFNSGTPQLHNEVDIIRKAFDLWQQNSGLTFDKVEGNRPADILIDFVRGDHGDGNPFDGSGKVLAHAYFPSPGIGGDAHFDEDEQWTDMTQSGTNLFQVAVHEFGHSLGLGHSKVRGAIMQAFYQGYKPDAKLHSDDIFGIQALYGRARATRRPGPNPSPSTNSPTTHRPDTSAAHAKLCRITKVDAICSTEDKILVFSGSNLFLMEGYGHNIQKVEAFKIKDMFLDITNDPIDFVTIDTPTNLKGKIRLFSKGKVWKYAYNFQPLTRAWNYMSLMSNYPKSDSSEIRGFPNGITAAFTWKQNGNEYFFKGNKYYRKQKQFSRMDNSYPKSLQIWRGVPASPEAVFSYTPTQNSDSATFFFKGSRVYWFNEEIDRVDNRFDVSISTFFGCESPRFEKLSSQGEFFKPSSAIVLFSILAAFNSMIWSVRN